MHWGTIGLGAVATIVVGLAVVVVVALSPAPFVGASDNRTEQPARLASLPATNTPTPATTALEREETVAAQSSAADLVNGTGLKAQPLIVSGFAIVTLTVGVLLALTYVRTGPGRGRRA